MKTYQIIEHPIQPQMALVFGNETLATAWVFATPEGYKVHEKFIQDDSIIDHDSNFINRTLEMALESAHRFLANIHHKYFSQKWKPLYAPLEMIPRFEKTVSFLESRVDTSLGYPC